MRKLLLLAAISMMPLTMGCELFIEVGESDNNDDDAVPVDPIRAQFENDVVPLLEAQCAPCHGGERLGIAFMAEDPSLSVYDNMLAWPALVNFNVPADSRLLTKGPHEGPGWIPEQADAILAWLNAEAGG